MMVISGGSPSGEIRRIQKRAGVQKSIDVYTLVLSPSHQLRPGQICQVVRSARCAVWYGVVGNDDLYRRDATSIKRAKFRVSSVF